MSGTDRLDEVLSHVESLPEGVQQEVRGVLQACLDVVGVATVRALELAHEAGIADRFVADRDIARLLALCGLEPTTSTPVVLSPRPGCEICGTVIGSRHDHAADVDDRRLLCVCRACAVSLTGIGRYRSLDRRSELVEDLDDAPEWWGLLGLPVEFVFFATSSQTEELHAFYPGVAGPVLSTLEIGSIPFELDEDVEAILVRARPRFEAWRVPVDRCYEFTGILRHAVASSPGAAADEFFGMLRAEVRA